MATLVAVGLHQSGRLVATNYMDDLDDLFDEAAPPPIFYAQVSLTVAGQAPLLAAPRLARITSTSLDECAPDAPGTLWGYIVLPDTVRFVVGPTGENALEAFITHVKAHTTHRLINAILRADDSSLDSVLRYNPVRGTAIYQVWQAGSHRTIFSTEYKLSNALYDLQQLPVVMGLITTAETWPYLRIGHAGA